ncbi:hypothetical protein DM01DRAFT_1381154 [Hesseltinella vesiculosa]|uniref:Uncharacterized protein n=1 Tax=Hesseltinella vesiculosa TaxID=101127 RepID=A0A1X2GR91_9FUNG|nr:hypothetical protein DM01DRAFT_1381154 [Hesseltinella vesiculosa]
MPLVLHKGSCKKQAAHPSETNHDQDKQDDGAGSGAVGMTTPAPTPVILISRNSNDSSSGTMLNSTNTFDTTLSYPELPADTLSCHQGSLLLQKAKSCLPHIDAITTCLPHPLHLVVPRSSKSDPPPRKDDDNQDDDDHVHSPKGLDGNDGWSSLENRLLDIITATIDQELKKYLHDESVKCIRDQDTQSVSPSCNFDTHSHQEDLDPHLSYPPSSCGCHPQVSLLQKKLEGYQTSFAALEQRLECMEHQQQQFLQHQARAHDQKYNELHSRYIYLVSQHGQQIEKYNQLQSSHHHQTSQLRLLQQRHPTHPTPTKKKTALSPPLSTSAQPFLPSPTSSPVTSDWTRQPITLPSPPATVGNPSPVPCAPCTTPSQPSKKSPIKVNHQQGYVEFLTRYQDRPIRCQIKIPISPDTPAHRPKPKRSILNPSAPIWTGSPTP